MFASSCSLIAQESIGQVKFSADDVVPSSSPKLFPGLTPEGVSVERDVGVGRESVGGYASASDCCPPTLTFPPHLLLPTPCSRQGVFCEDAVEQFVEECCGGCLDPTLPHLSPHLSLPPRIFICDYHDTKIALSFYLALTSSPDCVSGLWSESESPPPGTTVVPDVDTVDVNQPSDMDPRVSFQSFSSSVPSSVSSYFRFGSPVVRRITSSEQSSCALPLLWLVRLLLLVSACLLSVLHSLVTAAQFCLSVQVWLLRLLSLPRAFLGALRAFSHSSKAFYAFPSFIEEDFLGAVTASRGRQIVLDSGCSASTTNSESYFAGSFSKIARTLRFLVGSVVASAEGHVQVVTKGGNSSLARYMREGQPFRVAFNFLSCFSRP